MRRFTEHHEARLYGKVDLVMETLLKPAVGLPSTNSRLLGKSINVVIRSLKVLGEATKHITSKGRVPWA